jgi:DnaJ domain
VFPSHSYGLYFRTSSLPWFAATSSTTASEEELREIDFGTDPWRVLGLDQPTTDKAVIKRAYKRRAIQYHPDVVLTKGGASEQEKQVASARFARINAAYAVLTGKSTDSSFTTSSSSKSSSSSTSSYTPPHRRSRAEPYQSTAPGAADWRDFVPYQDDDDFQVGDDSLGKILADLWAGVSAGATAVAGASGQGGIFRDFVEFLEKNIDGYSSNGDRDEDAAFRLLLQTGSVKEVSEELDDTDIIVQQLSKKLQDIATEILTVQADLNQSVRYSERLTRQERLSELQARQQVVQGYEKQARKRWLSLQTRYKELIVSGDFRRNDWKGESAGRGGSSSPPASDFASASNQPYASTTSTEEDAWKAEGFGSFGRGRGSTRSRNRREQGSASPTSGPRTAEPTSASSSTWSRSASSSTESPSNARIGGGPNDSSTFVPPHRRTTRGPTMAEKEADRQRLRDIKVDEAFDNLKREMGL